MLLVTHNNSFHADDVFSAATLKLIFKSAKIKRSREEKYFEKGDIIFDVGGKYDEEKYFDHHQYGKAGERKDGYPYAAFGLIWKKFGIKLCGSQNIVDRIDESFVKYIDAIDSGYNPDGNNLSTSISEVVGLFNPNWNESVDCDKEFLKVVKTAEKIILRKIEKEKAIVLSKEIVGKAILEAKNKIIILDAYCNWQEEAMKTDNFIVIYPEKNKEKWMIRMLPKEVNSFENRIGLKEEWRGESQEKLYKLTGIEDFIFCHANGFIASTKTKESAIKIAEITIKEGK